MSYKDSDGNVRYDNSPMHTRVELRDLSGDEKKRLDEIEFWLIIEQMKESKAVATAPMGTTLPKMLATILGIDSGVIDYAYNALSLPENKPTNNEISLLFKKRKVATAKTIFTPDTFYKGLKRWKREGQPTILRSISNIQHTHIVKFLKNHSKAFMGKRGAISALAKGRI